MDLLGDILSTLELHATFYYRAELTAPFSIAIPEERNVIRYHVVCEGHCRIVLPDGTKVDSYAGDLLLVPHGAAHVISSLTATRPVPLPKVLLKAGFDGTGPLVYGGGGNRTALVCGHFGFGQEIPHPVIASLPPILHVPRRGELTYHWLAQLLAYMEAESIARSEAWTQITTRVAEIVFIYTLREYLKSHPKPSAALLALSDHRIARALQAVHADPSGDWSLERLAERAAMSRTAFAATFRKMVGVTPMHYVVSWRMHKARALIGQADKSIQAIALEVGYDSESAFNRAFKEYFGAPPGRFRRGLAPDSGQSSLDPGLEGAA